eukprot:3941981-Rhodomonas_salina.3
MSGMGIASAVICLCNVQYGRSVWCICLRACHARSGTDLACGVLPDVEMHRITFVDAPLGQLPCLPTRLLRDVRYQLPSHVPKPRTRMPGIALLYAPTVLAVLTSAYEVLTQGYGGSIA